MDKVNLAETFSRLQLDFMATIHGVRSFESLRSRAKRMEFGGHPLLVADLADIVKSKRAAGRPRDRFLLRVPEKTLDEKKQSFPKRQA